jgi:hypothetical protein
VKKLLVVLLALTFVVAISAVTFALATSTVDGKVEWTLTSGDQMGGTDDGKLIFDLGKDFGEGYSAGLKIKITPKGEDTAPLDEVKYDGAGWIKMVKDSYTATFQTDGLGGNAANELGGQYDMTSAPGVKIESSALMEGLALTLVLNEKAITDPVDAEESPNKYNYLIKAVYSADPLTLGFGYQMHSQSSLVTDSAANDMMAVWAGYKLGDALALGFEYGSRPNVTADGSTAIQVKADYTADPLTVNGKIRINTGVYDTIDDGDIGTTSAWNVFINGIEGMALKVDAAYQLTDALKVALTLEDILSSEPALADDQVMSYKLTVTDVLSEQTTASAWYAGYGENGEIGANVTYTFVAGLVGSVEVKSVTDGVLVDDVDAVNSYTVKLVATL